MYLYLNMQSMQIVNVYLYLCIKSYIERWLFT